MEAFLNEAERFQALQLVQYCHLVFVKGLGEMEDTEKPRTKLYPDAPCMDYLPTLLH